MKGRIILIIPLIVFGLIADGLCQADSITSRIPIVCRTTRDSVSLRWTPLDFAGWRDGNTFGYTIEKFLMAKGKTLVDPPKKIETIGVLKPLPLTEWEQVAKREKNSVVVAQALYGKSFILNGTETDVMQLVAKTQENQQRFSLAVYFADQSYDIALASGLGWTDLAIIPGERYLYRVSIVGSGGNLGEGSIFVDTDKIGSLPIPVTGKPLFENGMVTIPIDPYAYRGIYTTFYLEKSYNSIDFKPISELPYIQLADHGRPSDIFLSDTLFATGYYRVVGRTPFGESGPPSKTVKLVYKTVLEAIPSIHSVVSDNHNLQQINISWEFPEKSEKFVKLFRLEKAAKNSGPFFVVQDSLKPELRVGSDLNPANTNYYRVVARGFNNEETTSLTFFYSQPDSIAPSAPTSITGNVDTTGRVTIMWSAAVEKDIEGYKIYKAHFENEEPSLLSKDLVVTNSVIDHENLNTLNRKVYYYIMAIDQKQNHSSLSKPLILNLPDKVAPQPPTFLKCIESSSGIEIRWRPGGSDDVQRYDIYRRTNLEIKWSLINRVTETRDSVLSYVDIAAKPGVNYTYTVLSIDSSNLESVPATSVIGRRGVKPMQAVALNPPQADRLEMSIKLTWTSTMPDIREFHLYRKGPGTEGQFVLYRTASASSKSYADKSVSPGNSYSYFLVARFQNGALSALSDTHSIDF